MKKSYYFNQESKARIDRMGYSCTDALYNNTISVVVAGEYVRYQVATTPLIDATIRAGYQSALVPYNRWHYQYSGKYDYQDRCAAKEWDHLRSD